MDAERDRRPCGLLRAVDGVRARPDLLRRVRRPLDGRRLATVPPHVGRHDGALEASPRRTVGPSNYTVAASASDNSGAIASYTWWVDDVQQGATGSSLSLSAIASGSHTVKVRALDPTGNASAVVAKTVAIDRSVNVTPGALPAITNAATAALSLTADADVVSRTCSVNNGTADRVRLVGLGLGRRLLRLPRARHLRRQHDDDADRGRRPHAHVAFTDGPTEGQQVVTRNVRSRSRTPTRTRARSSAA